MRGGGGSGLRADHLRFGGQCRLNTFGEVDATAGAVLGADLAPGAMPGLPPRAGGLYSVGGLGQLEF